MWKNIYLFAGDPYLVQKKVKTWTASFEKKHGGNLNIAKVSLDKEEDMATITQEIASMPFLTPFKLIFVYNVLDNRGSGTDEEESGSKHKNIYDRFLVTCEEAPESSIVVFVSPKADKRRNLYKNIPATNRKEFKIGPDGTVEGYDEKNSHLTLSEFFFDEFDRKIPHETIRYLIQTLTSEKKREELDLFEIENLLVRINLFADQRPATPADVDTVAVRPVSHHIFDLSNALLEKDMSRTITILDTLLHSGEDIYMLWGFIIAHLSRLIRIKAMLQEKAPITNIRSFLGAQQFKTDSYVALLSKTPISALKQIYAMFLEIDIKLKTGGLTISTTDVSAFQRAIEQALYHFSLSRN